MVDQDAVNILIVDDIPDKLLTLVTILESLEQNLVLVSSGRDALRRLLEQDFAVILLDVNMPEMDGFDTAAMIRQHKRCANTPIIFITAFPDEVFSAQAYSLGAVDYILSPVVPAILRTKVGVFVDLYKKTEQVKKHAEERVALAREQAARAAAEEANRRSAFLAEASTVLASSLDYAATMRGLTRAVIPFLGDLSAITLAEEHCSIWQTELAWMDPAGGVCARTIAQPTALQADLAAALARVLATGTSEFLADLSGWQGQVTDGQSLFGHSPNGQAEPAFELKSLAILPLAARGRTLGALILAMGHSDRSYRPADLALAADLANRAAIAIDNARLYQNIQEADRRKDEFLAVLSHELRNPLAPIRNALHILRLDDEVSSDQREAREIIERQVLMLSGIVDDLLDVFRITHHKIALRKQTLDLVQLARQTAADHHSGLDGTGLTLRLEVPEAPVWVQADRTRLAQVMTNLLNNAAKFSNPGGLVTVRVTVDTPGQRGLVAVCDNGIGIAPEILPHIFETFIQGEQSLDRGRGGLGLGLALVKGLIELHGGGVQATSAGLGHGAEFSFWLPLTAEPAPSTKTPVWLASGVQRLRILIVEDNRDTAITLRKILLRYGHDVTLAHSGTAGLAAAQQQRPDVVLCDLGLPEMDGYEIAKTLRRDSATASIRLIAVSGYGQEEDRRRSEEAGFDLHLTKPVDPLELQRLLSVLKVGP